MRTSRLVTHLGAGRRQKVVAYGTSLTAGGGWVAQLAEELERRYPGLVTVLNRGQGSMWSAWGVEHLEERVLVERPDALFLEFSINDAFLPYATSVARARANLEAMVDRVLAANPSCEVFPMVMNPPTGVHLEQRPAIAAYAGMYRDVAAARGLQHIDHGPEWERILREDPARFLAYVPDGIHPNAEGCRRVVTPTILRALGLTYEPQVG